MLGSRRAIAYLLGGALPLLTNLLVVTGQEVLFALNSGVSAFLWRD